MLGTLVALIFFYIGLNQWFKQKPASEPPPVVIRPTPPPKPPEETQPKTEEKEQIPTVAREEQEPEADKKREDLIAEKIEEEKRKGIDQKEGKKTEEKPERAPAEPRKEVEKNQGRGETKEYVIQIGAFSSNENAQKALRKAINMGYKGEVASEDGFYKVRVRVRTDNLKGEINKLKSHFGGAIVKQ
ncbi:SPOR domain-containing protein [Thermocrinis sp.]